MLSVTGVGAEHFLKGIAAVLWPLAVVAAVVVLRNELRGVVKRIRHMKLFGNELDLDRSLDDLEEKVENLASATPPAPTTPLQDVLPLEKDAGAEGEIREILAVAAQSPRAALMQLSAALEGRLRVTAAATGQLADLRGALSLRRLGEAVSRQLELPRGFAEAVGEFSSVRNAIVHGHTGKVGEEEILRAIDSGIVLLQALSAVPLEKNVVLHSDVPIFAEVECTNPLHGHALILATTSPGGVVVTRRVFPTTKRYFRKGMQVSWEWSSENRWGPAWFRDPDTGEVKHAWDGSQEFVGRDLTAI